MTPPPDSWARTPRVAASPHGEASYGFLIAAAAFVVFCSGFHVNEHKVVENSPKYSPEKLGRPF